MAHMRHVCNINKRFQNLEDGALLVDVTALASLVRTETRYSERKKRSELGSKLVLCVVTGEVLEKASR
jgi:hypothetical protein